jgi:hypothetical protein
MHEEVNADIHKTPVDKIDDEFIKATYNHALKSICLKDPDVAYALKEGRQAVSMCSKVLRACAINKRKGKCGRGQSNPLWWWGVGIRVGITTMLV